MFHLLEQMNHLIASHRGKLGQEFLDRVAGFEMIKERADGNTSSREAWCAMHDIRIGSDDRSHIGIIRFLSRLCIRQFWEAPRVFLNIRNRGSFHCQCLFNCEVTLIAIFPEKMLASAANRRLVGGVIWV